MHGEVNVFHQNCCYFLDFGQSELSQRMKDYLAFQLDFDYWKKILRTKLTDEADDLIRDINSDNKSNYDRSYAIIRKLVEKGEATNASNYDATKAQKSKRKSDSEVWQDKILRCLEPVDVPEPAKKDYIDSTLGTVALQIKENLSHNEILDLIEDIQGIVNRACREKRRRIEIAKEGSNNNQIYQGAGPGPHGSMVVPVNYDEQHQQQQPFYNTF